MYIDKRMIYIIMAIMLISGFASYFSDINNLLGLLLSLPGILVAITFHEFAHAYVADKLGDDTPRSQGRLTLNPLGHLDPIGSIMLLFAGFGWGKPVEVNPRNYERRISMDKADAIVSIAGPLTNFLLAIIFTIVLMIVAKATNLHIYYIDNILYAQDSSKMINIIINILINIIQINIGLGIFNLIPLPPLDGSKVIKPFLSFNAKEWFEANEKIIEMVFVALWIFGILGKIVSPIISITMQGVLKLGFALFGI